MSSITGSPLGPLVMKSALREVLRDRAFLALVVLTIVATLILSQVPSRFRAATFVAASSFVAIQSLYGLLFAALFAARSIAAGAHGARRIGPLPLSGPAWCSWHFPGQFAALVTGWTAIVIAQTALLSWVKTTETFTGHILPSFLAASGVTLFQSLLLVGLARLLASFLPLFGAMLSLFLFVVAAQFLDPLLRPDPEAGWGDLPFWRQVLSAVTPSLQLFVAEFDRSGMERVTREAPWAVLYGASLAWAANFLCGCLLDGPRGSLVPLDRPRSRA